MTNVSISGKCLEVYPWMKFAYGFVTRLSPAESVLSLREEQKEMEDYIRRNSVPLIARAKSISQFYKTQGEKNRSHIESLIKSIANGKTIKPVNFIVDSVMMAELRNALLLGVHDLDRIQGEVVLDVAGEGERFVGIGNRLLQTKRNEVVLRDSAGIWASYTQGPDARTIVDASTKNVMILGFFTPETTREIMREGIKDAMEALMKAAKGNPEEIRIIPS